MILDQNKPKLFLYGACDLHDIVSNDLLNREFDVINTPTSMHELASLDFNNMRLPSNGTSIISLYTKPGPIAQRVLDTLTKTNRRDLALHTPIYKEVCKFPYLDFYKKNAGPNDFLVLSFSAEIYTKLFCVKECFSCLPQMKEIFMKSNSLHWLLKEYLSKEEYLFPFDTKESLEWSFDLLVDFARDIYEIFQDRVILLKTHFSNLVIATDSTVVKVNHKPNDLLFYRQTKIVTDPTDSTYAERLSAIIMNKFQHHYSVDLPLIKLDEPVFLDAHHRWGLSQFHIDQNSRMKLAVMIHSAIMKKSIKVSYE
jgi:hypothetical protein